MAYDASLVIHDGQLIGKDEALELMLEEFTPYGYSRYVIEYFIKRAHRETQIYLAQLRWLSPEVQKLRIGEELKKDSEIADRWRAKSREEREEHARRLESEVRIRHKAQFERELFVSAWKEQNAKDELAAREKRLERERRKWKTERERDFERWTKQNESGGWKAEAAARAESRRKRDQLVWEGILRRIREKTDPWIPTLQEGASQESMLCLLSDHKYIEWMFDCYGHQLVAPV
jgi:hypothetical protein